MPQAEAQLVQRSWDSRNLGATRNENKATAAEGRAEEVGHEVTKESTAP